MKIKTTLLTLASVAIFCSCSQFNALLKSEDVMLKYNAALDYYSTKQYNKAMTVFENVLPNMIGTMREDTVLFYFGKSLYQTGRTDESSEKLSDFRSKFTRSPFTEEAEYLLAMSYYDNSLNEERDQRATHQAMIAFNEYLNRYPQSIKTKDIQIILEQLQQKLYDKIYLNAALYYKVKQYNSAIEALRSALKETPEIPHREKMMYLIVKSWSDYAQGSIEGRQLDRYLKMIDAYYNFKTEFQDSEYNKELDRLFAQAKLYTDNNSVAAQRMAKNQNSVESREKRIVEYKEKLFEVDNAKDRRKIRAELKFEKEELRKLKQEIKTEKKSIKVDQQTIKPDKQ